MAIEGVISGAICRLQPSPPPRGHPALRAERGAPGTWCRSKSHVNQVRCVLTSRFQFGTRAATRSLCDQHGSVIVLATPGGWGLLSVLLGDDGERQEVGLRDGGF